jgi:1-deoxy-D-xylulose-5-phosphate reductoisomerase
MTIKISLLGSTGSIGQSTIKVARSLKDEIKIVGLSAGKNVDLLIEQIKEFNPLFVSVKEEEDAKRISRLFPKIQVMYGEVGNLEVASMKESSVVVAAIVGIAGLPSILKSAKLGKRIALANKEALVTSGRLLIETARKSGAELIPVDSEHCAIFQCLRAENVRFLERILLTGSGGALRDFPFDKIENASLKDVLNHPTWEMGRKITVDSATLINKGLEIIEASYLFGVKQEKIEVLIHRESIIHSLVEFTDGSVLAQLAEPDMALPIQYAITFPIRKKGDVQKIDFSKIKNLSFEIPDLRRYPCLKLAREAFATSEAHTISLNASNEVAVKSFIEGRINFGKIQEIIRKVIDSTKPYPVDSIEEVFHTDKIAREKASRIISKGE